jgi:DNA-binding Xre family transcriptional regulator
MASSRSLKLSSDGKQQVEHVLTDKAWGNDDLMESVGVQIATVKKFRAGRAVEKENFVKFCRALGLEWEKVAADIANESRTIQFLIRIGDHAYGYWHEVEKPTPVYSIQPLPDKCVQFFEIDMRKFVDDVDPSFDITLVSNLDSLNIVHQFGLDIISIANDWKAYGVSQAAEVLQQAKYEIEIPDIRNEIALEQSNARFPRLLEPRKINRSLIVPKSTKFILDADQRILNYEVLLKNYMQNMPNYAVIQFWIKTQEKQYFSDLIQIFSL